MDGAVITAIASLAFLVLVQILAVVWRGGQLVQQVKDLQRSVDELKGTPERVAKLEGRLGALERTRANGDGN